MSQPLPRVVHLASGDLWAGAEVQLFTLATQLARGGQWAVAVVLLNEGELAQRLRAEGVAVHVVPEAQHGFFSLLVNILGLLRTLRPSVVHTHRQKENILGGIAAALLGIPSVRTVHGSQEYSGQGVAGLRTRLVTLLDRWTGRWIQRRIIAVSEDLRTQLAPLYGARKLTTVLNGVDLEALKQATGDGRASAFEPKTARHIGMAGRLEAVKRVDLFLDAAAELRHRGKDEYSFHVFGDGALRGKLEEQARSLGIGDHVTFHGHCEQMPARLAGLDVLVMSSDHEGLPMVALESIAVGTPVVAHAVGGLVPLLEGDCGGLLVHRHDGTGYAVAIERLLGLDLDRTRRCGRERLKESYTSARNGVQVGRIYVEMSLSAEKG